MFYCDILSYKAMFLHKLISISTFANYNTKMRVLTHSLGAE